MAVGIVAEYNPFHEGHAYHIAETRRILGENTPVIAVMSGNWVQRGECAVLDKWNRAAQAVKGGVDLVLELPTMSALSSAERFAQGAIALLWATGVVDTLSFGSESGDLAGLTAIARYLDSEEYKAALRLELDKGVSFPEAREKAVSRSLGKTAALLRNPNDNLGVEYLRAAGNRFRAIAIPRKGAPHDGISEDGGFPSASFLRERIRAGELDMGGPVYDLGHLERAILSRLRSMTAEELEEYPDAGDSVARRVWKSAKTAKNLEELYQNAKVKRLTHARLRRFVLRVFLGIDVPPVAPGYLRVLALNRRGQGLLSAARLPVITKPAQHKELLFWESRLTDQFSLCTQAPLPQGEEFRHSPVFLNIS